LREQPFRCRSCKKEFTKIYIFENEHLVLQTKCPNCGSTELQSLDKTSSVKVQAEFAEKVKKMNQSRTGSQKDRRP
jgi:DNA-directed RNA polymerase subunit RPC12/RpoP